jgi:hypothetical protein
MTLAVSKRARVESEQNCVLSSLTAVPASAVLFYRVFETNILRERLTSEFSHSLNGHQPSPATATFPS